MKECKKWWNEERSDEEFLAKTEGITTQEQALDVLVELTWKAALEWALDSNGGSCDWDKIEAELNSE